MNVKATLFRNRLASAFFLGAVMAAGCKPVSTTTSTTTTNNLSTTTSTTTITSTTTSSTTTTTTIPTIEMTQMPYSIVVAIKYPQKIGETAELLFTVHTNNIEFYQLHPGTENARMWLEFYWTNTQGSYYEAQHMVAVPLSEVVVSGDTTWQGNYKEKGYLQLKCIIQLPREGVWTIKGFISGQDWSEPLSDDTRIAVTKDNAGIMSEPSFRSGPLGYLSNFYYGLLGVDGETTRLGTNTPIIVKVDTSKPPLVGEEVTITCTISSLSDVPNCFLQIDFYRRLNDGSSGKVDGSNFLVNGSLQWQGDLKQAQPTVLTTIIKFPIEGDWQIHVQGHSQANPNNYKGMYATNLELNISSAVSSYGWKPLRITPSTNTTQNSTVITTTQTK